VLAASLRGNKHLLRAELRIRRPRTLETESVGIKGGPCTQRDHRYEARDSSVCESIPVLARAPPQKKEGQKSSVREFPPDGESGACGAGLLVFLDRPNRAKRRIEIWRKKGEIIIFGGKEKILLPVGRNAIWGSRRNSREDDLGSSAPLS